MGKNEDKAEQSRQDDNFVEISADQYLIGTGVESAIPANILFYQCLQGILHSIDSAPLEWSACMASHLDLYPFNIEIRI